jgi:hypothetical protein
MLRRRYVTETFCYRDVLYGDILLRRRFVWKRFVCAPVQGFPITLSGIKNKACIRALTEVLDWLTSVSVFKDRDLVASRALFRKLVLMTGLPDASVQPGSSETSGSSGSHDVLPNDFDAKSYSIFLSQPAFIASNIDAISEDNETELMNELVLELNTNFMTDLAELTSGEPGAKERDLVTGHGYRYIVLGGSHAGQLAGSLDDLGLNVVDLSTPGWTVLEKHVEKVAAELQAELDKECDLTTIIVYQIFDNSVFHGQA